MHKGFWKFAGLPSALILTVAAAPPSANLPAELKEIPASRFAKSIEETESPDGRFAVAVGLKSPVPVVWADLREEGDLGFIFGEEPPLLANFIIDLKKDRALAIVGSAHFGTRKTYNHESFHAAWSEKSRYLITLRSWKWHTDHSMLHALNPDGSVASQLDLLALATAELAKVAGKKYKVSATQFDEKYASTVEETEVDEAGHVTLHAYATIPKSEDDTDVDLAISFTVKAAEDGKLEVKELKAVEKE